MRILFVIALLTAGVAWAADAVPVVRFGIRNQGNEKQPLLTMAGGDPNLVALDFIGGGKAQVELNAAIDPNTVSALIERLGTAVKITAASDHRVEFQIPKIDVNDVAVIIIKAERIPPPPSPLSEDPRR
jgi:hypothetical protein